MRTLTRFERGLGRRVSWGFGAHQIKIVPHAFAEANAFYSREEEALLFGYFPARSGRSTVYTCLSHDVVVHETTHALLDGLRRRYIDPSSPDQAAFHEGFADIVALLSVYALPGVITAALRGPSGRRNRGPEGAIAAELLTPERARASALLGLADQMGSELAQGGASALRQSAALEPSREYLAQEEFLPAHRRGEILVAAVMNAFLEIWSERLAGLRQIKPGYLDAARVAEEGANIADQLLTIAIRALDYTLPVHLEFCDYLSAMLTADAEIRPDDSRYRFREHLRETFRAYGIDPASGAAAPSPDDAQGPSAAPSVRTAPAPAGPSLETGTWQRADHLALISTQGLRREPGVRATHEIAV